MKMMAATNVGVAKADVRLVGGEDGTVFSRVASPDLYVFCVRT